MLSMPMLLSVNSQQIEQVHVLKYLGCMLDKVLNVIEHMYYIFVKLRSLLGVIKKCKTFFEQKY